MKTRSLAFSSPSIASASAKVAWKIRSTPVTQAHFHRLGRAGMGGNALAALARHLAHGLDLGAVHHRLLRPCPRH